jgi:hypothetical protein
MRFQALDAAARARTSASTRRDVTRAPPMTAGRPCGRTFRRRARHCASADLPLAPESSSLASMESGGVESRTRSPRAGSTPAAR